MTTYLKIISINDHILENKWPLLLWLILNKVHDKFHLKLETTNSKWVNLKLDEHKYDSSHK